MRCLACNAQLNDFEATRKSKITGKFVDLCNSCYVSIREDLQVVERYDLMDMQDEVDIEE